MLVNPSQPCQDSTGTVNQRRVRLDSSSNRPALVLILNVIIKYERSQEVSFFLQIPGPSADLKNILLALAWDRLCLDFI